MITYKFRKYKSHEKKYGSLKKENRVIITQVTTLNQPCKLFSSADYQTQLLAA